MEIQVELLMSQSVAVQKKVWPAKGCVQKLLG